MATPKLRFNEFDGAWEETSLSKLMNYFKGYAFKSKSYQESGIRIVRVSDLGRDKIKNHTNAIYLDKSEEETYKKWAIKTSDIIITTVGSKPHLIDSAVGRPIFIRNDKEGLLNQNLLILRPIDKHTDAYFIYSQLTDRKYLNHIDNIQRGNANQSNITVKDLLQFNIFKTKEKEQTKIATFLSAVDTKIDELTQKHELLGEYKKGMMQQIFSQKPRFKADDGSDFKDWTQYKLEEVATRVTRKNKEENQNPLTISAQMGLVNQQKYFNKQVASKNLSNYYLLYKGEYAYNKSYSAGYPMGAIKRLKNYDKGAVSTLYICFSLNDKINTDFFEHYVENGNLTQELEKIAQEGARNHGLLNVGIKEFFEISLSTPCLKEQIKIANFLTAIDQKIDNVADQIDQAKTWKKGLLQQMFV